MEVGRKILNHLRLPMCPSDWYNFASIEWIQTASDEFNGFPRISVHFETRNESHENMQLEYRWLS